MRLMSTDVAVEVAKLVLSVWTFMSVPPALEARPEAEAEVFEFVPRVVLQRHGIVHTDRPERRDPLDADAAGNAQSLAVENADLARVVGRSPQRADIDEGLAQDADLLGQADREAQLGGAGV